MVEVYIDVVGVDGFFMVGMIILSRNVVGVGWFFDMMLFDYLEFVIEESNGVYFVFGYFVVVGKYDLFSVMLYEVGYFLGFDFEILVFVVCVGKVGGL